MQPDTSSAAASATVAPVTTRWPPPTVVIFALVSAAVLVTTYAWTKRLATSVDGNLQHLLVFPYLFVRYDGPAALHYGVAFAFALIAARTIPRGWFDGLAEWIGKNPSMVALLSFVALALGSYLAYDDYPLSMDEFAQYFQAQIFAAGKLQGQYPPGLARRLVPLPNAFILVSSDSGHAMSGYWPGLPLLLAPFMFLGVPWVVNPLIGVAALLLVRYLARQLMPETPAAAGWAMLFMLGSPAFSLNAVSYYTMNAYLALGLAYAALLIELTPRRLFAAGVVGSLALVQHNPFPHAVFALPWFIWLMWRPDRVRTLFWLGLGYLPLSLPLLGGWWWIRDQFIHEVNAADEHAKAAGKIIQNVVAEKTWVLPSTTGLLNRLCATLKVYLWAVPGLGVICFYGYRRLRAQPVARLLAWSAIATYTAYFFVSFDQGHGWGYRYFHPAWGVLPLFGAAWVTAQREGIKWAPFMGALAIFGLLVLTPIRMSDAHQFIKLAESQGPPRDPDKRQIGFVNTDNGEGRYYAQDTVRNDPFLRNLSVRVSSNGPVWDDAFMQESFPGSTLVSQTQAGSLWNLDQ